MDKQQDTSSNMPVPLLDVTEPGKVYRAAPESLMPVCRMTVSITPPL